MEEAHPVEYFWSLLDHLEPHDYPDGVEPVPERITGTAFFSAGAGLVRRRGEPLPPFPFDGLMLVGHNLDAVGPYLQRLATGRDHGDPDRPSMPTWRRLYALLDLAGIERESIYCTNAYGGLKAGDDPTGKYAGSRDASFRSWCEAFLDEQIRVMRPRLVVALGALTQKELGFGPGEYGVLERGGVRFRALGLVHPSHPGYYRRQGQGRVIEEQAALLSSAWSWRPSAPEAAVRS